MKKLIISLSLLLFGLGLYAQQQAIGFRFGGGTYSGGEISYLKPMSESNRIELDLGFGGNSVYNAISLTGTYQWTFPLLDVDGLGWYVGPGASLGIWTYNDGISANDDNGFNVAIGGIIGIDYVFTGLPLHFSIDSRPMINLIGHKDYGTNWGSALSVRYLF